MRLRNKKGAHDIISQSNYLIKDYESYKGNFKSLFNNDNKIEIEIGMGKGDFIIGKAIQNPDINYIGIEKYATVLLSAFKKLDMDLPNLKIINMDANYIEDVFDKEVSKLYLNFSDPWPKKKHADRRLTSSKLLDKYNDIFVSDRVIEMKTDNMKLFEYSLCSLSEHGYILKEVNLDLHNSSIENNVETEYEKKFSALGQPIYRVVAIQEVDMKNEKHC